MARRPSHRGELIGALQQSVRRFGDEVNRYEAAVAERLGMHATDLHYLGFVELYGPTTAGHLAELGGLTTGAVTGVIDRLEKAGYVRRESDPADRRKVVIRLMPGAAERAGALYQPMLASTDPLWERYSDDELAVILDFADRAQPLLHEGTAWLRGGTERAPRAAARVDDRRDPLPARRPVGGHAAVPRGAGHVHIRGDRELTELYHGQFPGNVPSARVDRGVVSLRYGRSPFRWMARHGELALSTAVRWRFEVEAGMTRRGGRAGGSRRPRRDALGGVSHGSIALPPPRGVVPIHVTGGVNDLTVTRPPGTAARLRVRGGASNVVFDGRRFASRRARRPLGQHRR